MDYEILFDGTSRTTWGKYLEPANRANAQRFTAHPATAPPEREDNRGRPTDPLDILGVLQSVNLPINKTELMQRTGKSRERVYAELQRLIESGHVKRTWSHNQTALYCSVR